MKQMEMELQLMAYADGELSSEESTRVEAYLAENPDARTIVEAHQRMRSAVSAKVPDVKAPAYLRMRVRDGMRDSSPGFVATLREWWGSFQLGPAPSLALVAVTVLAVLSTFGTSNTEAPDPAVVHAVTLTGQVQCIDCTVSQQWHVDSECELYGHRNGLVTADGTMWTIKHSAEWSGYVTDTSMWGHTITVQGHRNELARYIDVISFELDEPAITDNDTAERIDGTLATLYTP